MAYESLSQSRKLNQQEGPNKGGGGGGRWRDDGEVFEKK